MKNNSDTNNVSKNIPDINKRILSIIEKYYEGNVSKFSEKIEKSQQQVNRFFNIDNRNNKYPDPLKTDIIDVIDKKFPEISKDWLLTGNGSMLVPQIEEVVPEEEEEENYLKAERSKYGLTLSDIYEHTNIPMKDLRLYDVGEKNIPKKVMRLLQSYFERVEEEYENEQDNENKDIPILITEQYSPSVKVPYYNVDFAGGWSSEGLFSQYKPSFFITMPDFERAELACNLIGNSISQRIKSGSIIGLRKVNDWQTYFPTNEVYGVVLKNDLRTVKLVRRAKEKGFIELVPAPLPEYNDPPYQTETVPEDYIIEFYQVVATAIVERIAY